MLKATSSFRSFFMYVGLAAAVSGCEIMPDPEFGAMKEVLSLSIVEAERSESGASADFTFRLANRGSTTAKACLGPSRSVSYKVASTSGSSSSFVDHPGCTREFTIQPGGEMTWAETLEVPRLSDGRVQLQVDVQIVNPRRCGSWGNCPAFDLKSNQFEIL